MSLDVLAGLIGRSKGWLSMIENGHLRLERRQDIAAIAEALEVSADSLLGQPAPEVQPNGHPYNFAPLRAVLLDAAIDDPPDIPARPVAVLAPLVSDQTQACRQTDYGTMCRQLPDIIGELQVHAATVGGREREQALRLLIEASGAAMSMVRYFGLADLAWISADRARQAAYLLADPVWSAVAAFWAAHARSSANKSRALLSTPHLADQLEPHIGDDTFAHDVLGMLHLSSALACAVQGDHAGAEAHGAEAARLAEPLGDRPDAWEMFGPSNVGIWRTSLAVEAGNAEEALTYANGVDPRNLVSRNRHAALVLEKARALALMKQDAAAVRELRHAERLSAAQVHHHPLIRELVSDMLERARRQAGGRDLQGLAWRMGIGA